MMQAATRIQPPIAAAGTVSHETSEAPPARRRNSDAAIKPPANGSHARARNEKNADPIMSLWLCQRHHAKEANPTAKNAPIITLGRYFEARACRHTSAATRGIQI